MDLHPPHEFTTPDDEDTNGTSDLRLTLTEAEADAPLCLPSRQSVQASWRGYTDEAYHCWAHELILIRPLRPLLPNPVLRSSPVASYSCEVATELYNKSLNHLRLPEWELKTRQAMWLVDSSVCLWHLILTTWCFSLATQHQPTKRARPWPVWAAAARACRPYSGSPSASRPWGGQRLYTPRPPVTK